MKNRVIVHFLPDEKKILDQMVQQDVRPPAAQIRYLLINEAVRRGMLPAEKANSDTLTLPGGVAVAA